MNAASSAMTMSEGSLMPNATRVAAYATNPRNRLPTIASRKLAWMFCLPNLLRSSAAILFLRCNAALIRAATGSATVAMTTAAGIVAPIAAATPGTHPELLAVATGAGSLVLSHVNDSGFWLIKEFFNMTVVQTLQTWTVAETIIGVAGLGFTLLLNLMV